MKISACRFCLVKQDLAPLFQKLSPSKFTRNQVYLATGVVILPSDSLPQVACKTCIERIKDAICLRNTSIETQNELQRIQPKSNLTNEKDASDLLYEIDNFKTNDEDLNILLKKINRNVRKTINSLTNNSQHDNNSHIDNKIANDNLNTGNESDNSQTDNFNYQTDFDHNYHRKSNNVMTIKVTSDGMTKYTEGELRKVLNISGKDDKLNKKLISKLDKKRKHTLFQSNPALLPTRKFRQLFQSTKNIETKKHQNSSKILKKRQKRKGKEENTIHIKLKTKTDLEKKSQFDNKLSQVDNKLSQVDNKISQSDNKSDNSNNHDNEDDFNSLIKTEDWEENQLKEIEVQKQIDKTRLEKFMSLAVSPYPINGRLQCKVCLHSLTRQGFVPHAKRHFPPEFACETCGKMFYGNSLLQYHRQRMHGQEKPLACPMCDYRAVWKKDLTAHMRIHTGERPYICDVCDSSFRVRGDIVQHMRTHFGIKTVKCPRCPHKLFKCLSDVAKHNRRTHHDFTYFCHLCPKTYHGYGGRSSVRKHLARVHGIPRQEQPLKLKYTKIPKPDEFQHGIIDFINEK